MNRGGRTGGRAATRYVRLLLPALLLALALGGDGPAREARADTSEYVRGSLTLLTNNGARVDWSPDGQTIYFDRRGGDGFWDIWRMDVDGGNQSCVTCGNAQLPARNVGNPKVDPSGRYMALQAEKASHDFAPPSMTEPGIGRFNDIWVLDLYTSLAYQISNVSSSGVAGVLHPHFDHESGRLMWAQLQGAGTGQFNDWAIVVADFLTSPFPHAENPAVYNPGPNPGWFETHGFGPDGSWIYFSCSPLAGMDDVNGDICRMDFSNPSQVTRLTSSSGLNGEPAEWDEHAHLSPQGDAFIFMSSNGYGPSPYPQIDQLKTDAWIMNADGTGQTRVTYFNQPGSQDSIGEQAIVSDLDWNPDGTAIVMRVQFRFTANPDRIYILLLCRDANSDSACDAAASPYPANAVAVQSDTVGPGDDLLFTSIRHLPSQPPSGQQWYPEVFALDVDTMAYHRLTWLDSQAMRHMALSPDHRKLAMTRIPSDTTGDGHLDEMDGQVVWIVDLVAGKAWPLTETGDSAGPGGVDWLDNETVVFAYRRSGETQFDIAKADYRTRVRTKLTNTDPQDEADVGVSADRSMISYVTIDWSQPVGSDEFGPIVKPKIWVANADGSNPRQITDGGPLIGRGGLLSAGDYDPELSPDNSKVAFGRMTQTGTNDPVPGDGMPGWGTDRIYIADVNTLAVTELTQNDSVALIPDWADSGAIYFSEVAITSEHFSNPYLGVATTTASGGLTRIEPYPPDVWKGGVVTKLIPALDSDGDRVPDATDPDDDNDLSPDAAETPCGSDPLNAASVPERTDLPGDDDGDTLVDEALPPGASAYDCDGDGYTGTAETHVFPTAQADQDPCGTDAWPADLTSAGGFSANKVNISDLAAYVGVPRYFNTNVGTNTGDVRYDIVPGSTFGPHINIVDLQSVAFVTAPMLGGARMFNGPSCPWLP